MTLPPSSSRARVYCASANCGSTSIRLVAVRNTLLPSGPSNQLPSVRKLDTSSPLSGCTSVCRAIATQPSSSWLWSSPVTWSLSATAASAMEWQNIQPSSG